MFESYPDLKSAFGPFKHLTQNDSDYEEVLRSHGVRVVSIVELVLSKSPDNEDVIENLHELGRKHLSFNAKVEYIDVSGGPPVFWKVLCDKSPKYIINH